MTTIHVQGTLLTANADDRVLEYLLLPFGEEGRTSAGRVTASAGALTIPERIVANMEHDRTRPVATSTYIREDEDGIRAGFRVATTTAGNDLLIEATEGLRTGISVEVEQPVIRAGALLGGLLDGAGFVTTPAFPSARLAASDCGDLDGEQDDDSTETPEGTQPEDEAATAAEKEGTVPETAAVTETAPLNAAQAPLGLPTNTVTPGVKNAEDLFSRLAAAHSAMDGGRMLAALDEAVQADVLPSQQTPWLGEVWASRTHRQKYVPLFTRSPLTALKMVGWEFDVRTGTPPQPPATPTVGTYAGFPAEPTSTEVKTKAVEVTASRLAGANAIDRAFVDFSTPEFWRGYYREAANDLSRKQDAYALAHMLTAANYTAVTAETVPTDVAIALSYILDGVIAIQDIAVPDFAVVGIDLWRSLALTKKSDAVEYLSVAVGLDPAEGRLDSFQIVPSADATLTGKVLVGASEAHTYYGDKEARVETVNVGTGGVETGLFSYQATHTGSASAFALVAGA